MAAAMADCICLGSLCCNFCHKWRVGGSVYCKICRYTSELFEGAVNVARCIDGFRSFVSCCCKGLHNANNLNVYIWS